MINILLWCRKRGLAEAAKGASQDSRFSLTWGKLRAAQLIVLILVVSLAEKAGQARLDRLTSGLPRASFSIVLDRYCAQSNGGAKQTVLGVDRKVVEPKFSNSQCHYRLPSLVAGLMAQPQQPPPASQQQHTPPQQTQTQPAPAAQPQQRWEPQQMCASKN